LQHLELLKGWGHTKLANHLAKGGQPETFDEDAPEIEHPPAALALRDELSDLKFEPQQDAQPERGYDDGGYVEPMSAPSYDVEDEESEFRRRMAKKLSERVGKEVRHIGTLGGAKDFLMNHIVAPTAGGMSDITNLGLEGVDYLREGAAKQNTRGYKASVMGGKGEPPAVKKLASDKPFMGSEQFRDMYSKYGITSGEDQTPIVGMVGDVFANPMGALSAIKAVPKVVKGAKIVVEEGLPRAAEMGANRLVSDVRRPYTPVDITVEGVGPDLGTFKPTEWQEYITNQTVGKGSTTPMEKLGGRKTRERRGQGVYYNDAGQLEMNPMKAFSVKSDDLGIDKALRADIATAGRELNQEAMAAHRFVPMATNQIKDATALMIKTKSGKPLTTDQVKAIGKELRGMIVSHNPRTGGVFVAPYEAKPNQINPEFLDAQSVANKVLGKDAAIQYGKSQADKDLMYMHSSTYGKEGAKPASQAAVAKRQALKKMDPNFVAPSKLRGGLRSGSAQVANTAD
jgi:hypothetical protein